MVNSICEYSSSPQLKRHLLGCSTSHTELMTLFDLLFIVLFLTALGVLAAALIAALRGRPDRALRRLRRLGLGALLYMIVVTVVSVFSPRRVVALGEDQCSDDWCIAVTDIARTGTGAFDTYKVAFRLSSRARRVTQRERFVVAYMRDSAGERYDASPGQGEPPFDASLAAGASILTSRSFAVRAHAVGLGVVVAREGGFGFPRCCIIGEGLFHKPPIIYAH